ncbi:MAG: hypothetical protein ABH879_08805 [archaeon]
MAAKTIPARIARTHQPLMIQLIDMLAARSLRNDMILKDLNGSSAKYHKKETITMPIPNVMTFLIIVLPCIISARIRNAKMHETLLTVVLA